MKREPNRSRGRTPRVVRLLGAVAMSVAMSMALLAPVSRAAEGDAADAPVKPGAKPVAGKPYVDQIPGTKVTFKMLPIPEGKFMMGSPTSEKHRKDDEGPQHEVKVEAFWMGECEVTQPEYQEFLENYHKLADAGTSQVPADKMADAVTYPTPMYELEAGPILDRMGRGSKYPAVIMSQLAARQYTKWLSKRTGRFYRLPTEAEWEYAARAGTNTAYSFGDDPAKLGDYAWTFDNSNLKDGDPGYHEVKQKKPNPWGLYDMYGNVAEWTIDAYAADWYKQFAGKTTDAKDAIKWPHEQYPRVLRGGSWNQDPEEARSAARTASSEKINIKDPQLPKSPHWVSDGFWVGFRIMAPVQEPTDDVKRKFWDVDDEYTKKVLQRDREVRDVPTLAK